ncbi:MAG: hypothetical protein WC934_13615 [Acidithiobacillus sp.]|uniref:hypothetical protein n=1 Tax=Acidithiobacillus sp. TaxID=1872118 RepID=UPI00355F72EE
MGMFDDIFDKVEENKRNAIDKQIAKTYCEYIGSKVNKSNIGCQYDECNDCKYKKEYRSR